MDKENWNAFAKELSELSCKYGIAINGEPELFVMEPEDFQFGYEVDEESRIRWGGAPHG